MDNWLAIAIAIISVLVFLGNLSTFKQNSKHKMRETSLNDRKETLPRTNKTAHRMPEINTSINNHKHK
ncbi:hypothetical protein [Colwellia sp. E2M01]|uniref:hypothetical protein n=1 Tax=Colwellia sp. E2M01 TaxID=2841561 RepID=UPI001C098168|nr:hypothetical protein [Colwellia sp. E2M01]MBU2871278.1 hypothetical protein [Colwellia sp. E2M01]